MLNSLLKLSNQLFLYITFTTLVLPSGWAYAVDFETIYQEAIKNNPELKKVKASMEENKAVYQAAKSSFLPKVGLESRYEEFNSDQEKLKGNTTSAFLEWNIFNKFKDIQNQKQLELELKAVGIEKNRFENSIKWAVLAKYAKAKSMQENSEALKVLLVKNQKNFDALKKQRFSGRLAESDFLEFELFISKLKQKLISLEIETRQAFNELETFSGFSPIERLTSSIKPQPLTIDNLDIKQILSSENSKVYQSLLKVESAQMNKNLLAKSFLPEINIKTSYGNLGLRETDFPPETIFGITAKWELFSGFESVNKDKIANAQLIKAQAEFEENKMYTLSRVQQILSLLKKNIAQYEFEEKNQKNIQVFFQSVQNEYKRGIKTSGDLKSALELVVENQSDLATLSSDYFQLRAELQELLGIEIKNEL